MNSQKFIETNRETWESLQQILERIEKKGASRLSRGELEMVGPLFRLAAAHLAYAQANYPGTDVVDYLNGLVARAHSRLFKTETISLRSVVRFYATGFPRLVWTYGRYIAAAAAVMLLGIVWGGFLNHINSPLATLALPEEIRNAVRENFSRGKVGADIRDSLKPLFSSGIMINNILVSIICLVLGITWGVGTVFILVRNGLLLGALADIFAQSRHSLQFWSLILPHGILELFAVVLNGGAGLLIASAVVRPGDLTRRDALKLKTKPAMLISAGSIPILVIAAIIEGFVTPLEIMPWLKLAFAGFTAVLIFLYIYLGGRETQREDVKVAGFISV